MRSLATRAATLTVENNLNHPSILTWSLANEPAEAGAEPRHATGPRSCATSATPRAPCASWTTRGSWAWTASRGSASRSRREAHQYLDVLGVNEYFGWYRSVIENRPDLPATTTADLSGFLDSSTPRTRTCRS